MSSKGAKVETRDPSSEALKTLNAMPEIADKTLSLRKQYDPQFTQLNEDNLRQAMLSNLGLAGEVYPQLTQMDSAAQQAAIAADPILSLLQGQAVGELGRGGDLTQEERIAADEVSNQRFAGTGMLSSNKSLINRILNRGDYSQNRLNNRRSFATGISQLTYGAGGNTRSLISSLVNPSMAGSVVGNSQIDPYNQYFQDAYTYNANAQNQANQSAANRRASLTSGLIKGIGSIGMGSL